MTGTNYVTKYSQRVLSVLEKQEKDEIVALTLKGKWDEALDLLKAYNIAGLKREAHRHSGGSA